MMDRVLATIIKVALVSVVTSGLFWVVVKILASL